MQARKIRNVKIYEQEGDPLLTFIFSALFILVYNEFILVRLRRKPFLYRNTLESVRETNQQDSCSRKQLVRRVNQ